MTSVLTTEEGDKKRQEDIIHFSVFPDSSMGGDNISAAPIDVDPKKPPPGLSSAQRRVYSKDHLEVYDLLGSPIWVFDIENKAMWWANEAACYLWSATDNESLCKRDFASDMSKASERSMNNWLEKFALGEDHRVTWTFHPNGGKDGPKTCDLLTSGIWVSKSGLEEDKQFCMLLVVEKVTDGKSRDKEDIESIRRAEMLRHFPIVARQFHRDGTLMDQNPEALAAFGAPLERRESVENSQQQQPKSPASTPSATENNNGEVPSPSNAKRMRQEAGIYFSSSNDDDECDFLAQFVDLDEGKQVLQEVQEGHDYSTETQQVTTEGPKWFTVNVRSIRDPVTSEPVIIYSGRDITKVMEAAKEEAEKQNMKRDEFFAVMAHEIRTPLHQVVGSIELLAVSGLNAEQIESVDMLQTSAHALMAIINDLLDFTKLESGNMKIETIPFEVRGVLEGSVACVQPQVYEKGLHVSCQIDQGVPIRLMGDPNRLRQVVLNMLSNAVKFTSQGRVDIESKTMPQEDGSIRIRFTVADTGIGIPKEECERIFNPYQQADVSVSRNYGGTGLGLAICKSLVENMDGEIGVDSVVGVGTTFWFEIPFGLYAKPHAPEEKKAESDSNRSNEISGLEVLVAEDNKVNQKVVVRMLQRLGHHPTVVENGQECVAEITNSSKKYDIILMDWQMPVMDGIDATKEIRRKGYNMSDLPIVGLTASIQFLDFFELGMNDCLKKPVRISDLKAALIKNVS